MYCLEPRIPLPNIQTTLRLAYQGPRCQFTGPASVQSALPLGSVWQHPLSNLSWYSPVGWIFKHGIILHCQEPVIYSAQEADRSITVTAQRFFLLFSS